MATGSAPSALIGALAGRPPASPSSFIGRGDELDAVARARASDRLVTLVGPGGAGKTRMALETLRRGPSGPDRLAFVDLARVPVGGSLAVAVAEAAGLRGVTERDAAESVRWWLDLGGESLVVLDSAEHVLDEAAGLVTALLEGTQAARVLVTSRQPLRVAGERVVGVGPMSQQDAEALFWERALAVRASLPETAEARAAARELCRRVDGLPLAVELAAARMTVMAPAEMLAELERGTAVLGLGPSTAPARHRSLRACIAGSVDALPERTRIAFEACAVFAGPFDAQAAAAVAHASLDDLEDLVSRSLLQVSAEDASGTVFRMLATLREYALEGLAAGGRLDAAHRRHVAWLSDALGADHFPSVMEGLRRGSDARVLPELRAALDFAAAADPAAGLRLMASTEELWRLIAEDEGSVRVERLLDAYPHRDEVRAGGLVTAACLSLVRQEADRVADRADEALGILGPDTGASATVQLYLAIAQLHAGDIGRATAEAHRALEAFTAVGDEAGQCRARGILGTAALFSGRPADAVVAFDEALRLAERAGDLWGQGQILTHWGMAESELGHTVAARVKLRGALERFLAVGDVAVYGSALALLARVELRRDPGAAVRAAASAAGRQGAGGRYDVRTLADIESVRTEAVRLMGNAAAESAWAVGQRLTFAEASAMLRGLGGGPGAGILTPRELEVAEMVRQGHSNASIARRLGVSERTVESHVAHATSKLGLHNRTALAGWVAEHRSGS